MTCLPCYIILRGLRVFNYAKRPFPQRPTAWRVTPSSSASRSCDQLRPARRVISFYENVIPVTPFL